MTKATHTSVSVVVGLKENMDTDIEEYKREHAGDLLARKMAYTDMIAIYRQCYLQAKAVNDAAN